ncbi:MAG: phosphoserine phosphatase SerB [Alphaproteobacteria bacterium]|nr:phosphoserine phosphatase SerB [Alphaproteobacteria bacterium]
MTHVLTLVGAPLTQEMVATARAVISGAAAPDWLAEGEACDIRFLGTVSAVAELKVRTALVNTKVDLCVQPAAGRRKRLLATDMDSTVITCECIDELADFVGVKAQVAAITERAMQGEFDFAASLKARIGLMQGIPEDVLQTVFDQRVRAMPGARTLVQTMRQHGAFTALVSGGFTFFTTRVREMIGFDTDRSNELVFRKGRLAGIADPVLGAEAKLAALKGFAAERGIPMRETMAVGDGANDIPMLEAAGLGVAYHAKPRTVTAAKARVDHADLTALLYFQGYRRSDFVA